VASPVDYDIGKASRMMKYIRIVCGVFEEQLPPKTLKICSRCKAVKYCSRKCQKEHWKYHKHDCLDLAKSSIYDRASETVKEIAERSSRLILAGSLDLSRLGGGLL